MKLPPLQNSVGLLVEAFSVASLQWVRSIHASKRSGMQGLFVYGQGGCILLVHRAAHKVGDSRAQWSFTELIVMATEHLGRSNDRMRDSG